MQNITKIDVYGILYLKPRDKAVMLKVETTSCLKKTNKQTNKQFSFLRRVSLLFLLANMATAMSVKNQKISDLQNTLTCKTRLSATPFL